MRSPGRTLFQPAAMAAAVWTAVRVSPKLSGAMSKRRAGLSGAEPLI
jgi:hypothetical protein